jgi:hypothetical protein
MFRVAEPGCTPVGKTGPVLNVIGTFVSGGFALIITGLVPVSAQATTP